MLVGVFNRISAVHADNVCVYGVVDTLPKRYTLTGFSKATKTCPAAKRYWRPLNSKKSLPVLNGLLKVSFRNFFADNYIPYYI